MVFGDSAWAAAAFCSEGLEVPYSSVTVNVTNVPIAYTLNSVTTRVDQSVAVTNVPIAFTINDITITATTTITVSGVNLNVGINDATTGASSSVTVSNTPLEMTVNTGGAAYGWIEVDTTNTTTWGQV